MRKLKDSIRRQGIKKKMNKEEVAKRLVAALSGIVDEEGAVISTVFHYCAHQLHPFLYGAFYGRVPGSTVILATSPEYLHVAGIESEKLDDALRKKYGFDSKFRVRVVNPPAYARKNLKISSRSDLYYKEQPSLFLEIPFFSVNDFLEQHFRLEGWFRYIE